MKIAILGTGSVGQALGEGWARHGHQIVFGTRDPESEKVQDLLEKLGGAATAVLTAEAPDQTDIIILATPWSAAESVVRSVANWEGKILVDATNPIGPGFQLTVGHTTSAGELVASWAAGARVVKCFNTTGAENMRNGRVNGEPTTMFLCGDDQAAKTAVSELAESLGFQPADVGDLSKARYLEPLAMVWINLAIRQGMGRNLAFRLVQP